MDILNSDEVRILSGDDDIKIRPDRGTYYDGLPGKPAWHFGFTLELWFGNSVHRYSRVDGVTPFPMTLRFEGIKLDYVEPTWCV